MSARVLSLRDVDARLTDVADGIFDSSGGPERRRAQPKMEQDVSSTDSCSHLHVADLRFDYPRGAAAQWHQQAES